MSPIGGRGRGLLRRGAARGVVVLAVAGFSVAATSAPASASGSVTPVLQCVWHVANTSWISSWGYSNSTGSTQTIPVGANNDVTPGAANQGQPTSFSAGTQSGVYTLPFDASSPPTWSVNGTGVSASPSDKRCSSDPVPIVAGTGGWTGQVPLVFVAVGIVVVGLYLWRRGPDLLALAPRGSRRGR